MNNKHTKHLSWIHSSDKIGIYTPIGFMLVTPKKAKRLLSSLKKTMDRFEKTNVKLNKS